MNIVNSGVTFKIFDESVKTYNELPVGTYYVDYSQLEGYKLRIIRNLNIAEEKIYGDTEYNVNKILKSFKLTNRNFGVILSGEKGVGKSLFAKVLAEKANLEGLPLIIVNYNTPGLTEFISSINQECIILFDEFEKNFPCDYEGSEDDINLGAVGGVQNNLLSLFDGLDNGKKLFVITCNDTYKLSEFFLNRPGRFHYHFEIKPPEAPQIEEYLKDKLDPKYYDIISKIIQLSYCGTITYDCLRALAFEINQGYPLSEIVNSLNLTRNQRVSLEFKITLASGKILIATRAVDLLQQNKDNLWGYCDENCNVEFKMKYTPSDIVWENGKFKLDPSKVVLNIIDRDDVSINQVVNKIEINKFSAADKFRYYMI